MTTPSGPGAPETPRHASTRSEPESSSTVQQAVSTASDEASRVTDVAKEQAQEVASEAQTQARDLVGELKTQIRDQSVSQRDRLAQTLRQFGDELDEMNRSTSSSGLAYDLAGQAASKARELSTFLTDNEPGDLIEQIREFARRRPGTFLAGAALAGVVAGRLTRGAMASSSTGTSTGPSGSYQAGQPRVATLPPATAPEDPAIGRAAETQWNVGNGPTEPSDSAVSSVRSSGQLPPDEPLISGQGRP
jgi:vacuolar-type H+-ATPase subunit H